MIYCGKIDEIKKNENNHSLSGKYKDLFFE